MTSEKGLQIYSLHLLFDPVFSIDYHLLRSSIFITSFYQTQIKKFNITQHGHLLLPKGSLNSKHLF